MIFTLREKRISRTSKNTTRSAKLQNRVLGLFRLIMRIGKNSAYARQNIFDNFSRGTY